MSARHDADMTPPGAEALAPLRTDAEARIRFTSLFINVRALSRSLRQRPPNRFTRHQLGVLRDDLVALCE